MLYISEETENHRFDRSCHAKVVIYRDAWVLRADERRSVFESFGRSISNDPEISEWGNRAEKTLSACSGIHSCWGTWELKHLSTRCKEKENLSI